MRMTISGVAPHIDGDYDIDLSSFTNRELHQIKVASGVRPLELTEAFAYSDAAFACAIATIACQRVGKRINEEIFMDAAGGSIQFAFVEPLEEEAEDPTSEPVKSGSKRKGSGKRSESSSVSPEDDPSPSGEQT